MRNIVPKGSALINLKNKSFIFLLFKITHFKLLYYFCKPVFLHPNRDLGYMLIKLSIINIINIVKLLGGRPLFRFSAKIANISECEAQKIF